MKSPLSLIPILVIVLLLAACAPTPTAAPAPAGKAATCAPTSGTQVLTHDQHGYCLLYPADYKAERYSDTGTALVKGDILNHTDPRVDIQVELAAGQTAEQAAAKILAEVKTALPGFTGAPTTATVAGRPAVVLDKLPGQELSRDVFLVEGGRLYRLTFTHADPAQADTFKRMEGLYTTVTNSFTFIPAR